MYFYSDSSFLLDLVKRLDYNGFLSGDPGRGLIKIMNRAFSIILVGLIAILIVILYAIMNPDPAPQASFRVNGSSELFGDAEKTDQIQLLEYHRVSEKGDVPIVIDGIIQNTGSSAIPSYFVVFRILDANQTWVGNSTFWGMDLMPNETREFEVAIFKEDAVGYGFQGIYASDQPVIMANPPEVPTQPQGTSPWFPSMLK